MAIENVKEYFKTWNIEDRIKEFDVSSATVTEAAKALNCEEKEIAKTMSFMGKENPILVVMAGDARIANPKFKAQFSTKPKMVKVDDLDELIGHTMGGVCPFAVKKGVKVYLDESLKRFERIFPACGSSNSAIELTIEELEKYSQFEEWVDIGKDYE